ncbi:MAG TPA: type II secretion system F family protein [Tepidisphaeraceae bacterium]|jgi:tight adherence protein C|nr:type II secretion system F family protein [Tepidisphaeraceae bacterium]
MDDQLLLIICGAGALGLIAFFVVQVMSQRGDGKLRDRLKGKGEFAATAATQAKAPRAGFKELAQRLGQLAAEPFMPKTREKQSGLRADLARAGVYSTSAVRAMTGGKVIGLGAGLGFGYLVGNAMGYPLLGVTILALGGYMSPKIWMKMRIKSNQRALTNGLADALDLMVVCIEAGLTVDSAMQRVGQELTMAHPALSRELSIAHMETRVGLSRAESLKNLGQRTGNAALQSLASMLIQADRFGTSVAQALRVHCETLRLNRQMAAEENAAKASVKMTFPLVLFIFPATFIILAGPTILNLMNSELFK